MFSPRVRFVVFIAACMVLAGTTNAAEEFKKKPKPAPRGFLEKFLAPQMDTRLKGEFQAAEHFTNPAANPWTKDDATVARVEKGAIRATKGALKRYAIESLGIDAWSLPLVRGKATGVDALKTASGGTRLRFGFSHLAPRAEVLIPVKAGRVSFSADALGRMSTSFEMPDSRFRVGAAVDPRAHEGTFSLGLSF
jgi:autotransporter translocation and assembly factor TamB